MVEIGLLLVLMSSVGLMLFLVDAIGQSIVKFFIEKENKKT
jgi:hypothetical protein